MIPHTLPDVPAKPVLPESVLGTDLLGTAYDALRDHALFRAMSPSDFEEIASRVRHIDMSHNERLYRQDMDAHAFYFLVSGRIRLYRLDYSGLERTLDSVIAGQCFAEVMIYANPARYACHAESLRNSRVLAIPIAAYRTLIGRRPEYAEITLAHYAGQAMSRFNDLEIMTVQSARNRLIRYLLSMLPNDRSADQGFELPLPKGQIASRLAMQPETFSRQLNDLRRDGLLRINGSHLVILDRQRLKQLGSL